MPTVLGMTNDSPQSPPGSGPRTFKSPFIHPSPIRARDTK
jgi:hypothetical protein